VLIIFLDFDGVINHGSGRWKSALTTRLNQITDQTGAQIVIHSTWRYGRTLERLQGLLASYHDGVGVTGDVLEACEHPLWHRSPGGIWVNEDNWASYKAGYDTDDERAIAIQRWLDRNPEVERYVIFDDCSALGHFVGTPEFMQTQMRVGLTDEHVEKAVLHLKG
jgi:hypothetical protein